MTDNRLDENPLRIAAELVTQGNPLNESADTGVVDIRKAFQEGLIHKSTPENTEE